MEDHPLHTIQKNDKEFFDILENTQNSALSEGNIPVKYKLLMAMALDAGQGATDGVRSLALQAMEEGATKEEIMETFRIANYICGIGSAYTAASALKDII